MRSRVELARRPKRRPLRGRAADAARHPDALGASAGDGREDRQARHRSCSRTRSHRRPGATRGASLVERAARRAPPTRAAINPLGLQQTCDTRDLTPTALGFVSKRVNTTAACTQRFRWCTTTARDAREQALWQTGLRESRTLHGARLAPQRAAAACSARPTLLDTYSASARKKTLAATSSTPGTMVSMSGLTRKLGPKASVRGGDSGLAAGTPRVCGGVTGRTQGHRGKALRPLRELVQGCGSTTHVPMHGWPGVRGLHPKDNHWCSDA